MLKGLGDGEQAGRSSFPGGCGAERRAEDRQEQLRKRRGQSSNSCHSLSDGTLF